MDESDYSPVIRWQGILTVKGMLDARTGVELWHDSCVVNQTPSTPSLAAAHLVPYFSWQLCNSALCTLCT